MPVCDVCLVATMGDAQMTRYTGEKAATSLFHEAMMRAGGLRWAMPTLSAAQQFYSLVF
jgi:hypothetical protein